VSATADGSSRDVQRYVYVGDQIYAVLDGNAQVVDRYARLDGGVLLGRIDAGSQRLVYATDRLGSVAATYVVGVGALRTPSAQELSFDGLGVRAVWGPLDRQRFPPDGPGDRLKLGVGQPRVPRQPGDALVPGGVGVVASALLVPIRPSILDREQAGREINTIPLPQP
jgi:hypothetical protein